MALEQLGKNTVEGCVAPGVHKEVAASGAAARTLKANESGGVFLLDSAAGVAYTLPAPVAGMEFTFVATVTVTAADVYAITTDAATTFLSGGVVVAATTSAIALAAAGNGSSHVTVTMNGSTTGGLIGTVLRFTAVSSTVWAVSGQVAATGTIATPFA
jgi:hypothetical protein